MKLRSFYGDWRSPLMGVLVGLTLVLGTVWLSDSRAETVDRIAAIVNEDIILLSELNQAMAAFQRKMSQDGVSDAKQQQVLKEQRSALLNQLINEKLTGQQVARLGLKVDEAEIDATVAKIKQVNKLSDASLQQMLDLEGLSMADYRARVKEQLLQNRVVNLEVRSKIVVTDEDVKAYYEAHKAQFVGPAQYHLRQILLKTDPAGGEEEHRNVLEKMRAIRQKLTAGENFAELAKAHSQSSTAANGGDLGLFEERLLMPQIRQALQGLQAGQFTEIVETEQGYQILWIEERVNAAGKSLEEARPAIQEKLYADVVEAKFQSWLKHLREKAHIKILE